MRRPRKGAGLRLVAESVHGEKRRCATCGDFIDPIDWCPSCSKGDECRAHNRPRKRSDAKFCDAGCRSEYRASFIRDCL